MPLTAAERKHKQRKRDNAARSLTVKLWNFFKQVEEHIPYDERVKFVSTIEKEEKEALTFLLE